MKLFALKIKEMFLGLFESLCQFFKNGKGAVFALSLLLIVSIILYNISLFQESQGTRSGDMFSNMTFILSFLPLVFFILIFSMYASDYFKLAFYRRNLGFDLYKALFYKGDYKKHLNEYPFDILNGKIDYNFDSLLREAHRVIGNDSLFKNQYKSKKWGADFSKKELSYNQYKMQRNLLNLYKSALKYQHQINDKHKEISKTNKLYQESVEEVENYENEQSKLISKIEKLKEKIILLKKSKADLEKSLEDYVGMIKKYEGLYENLLKESRIYSINNKLDENLKDFQSKFNKENNVMEEINRFNDDINKVIDSFSAKMKTEKVFN